MKTEASGRLSDEVWAQLGEEVAHLDDREARVVRRSTMGVSAALVAATAVWALGPFSPHLDTGESSGATFDSVAHTAQYEFNLVNHDLWPTVVVGASTDVPGVIVTSMTPSSLNVPRASSHPVSIALRVQDCTAAVDAVGIGQSTTPFSLRVIVSRPWGTVTSNIRPPGDSWLNDLVLYACGQESP